MIVFNCSLVPHCLLFIWVVQQVRSSLERKVMMMMMMMMVMMVMVMMMIDGSCAHAQFESIFWSAFCPS